jgi:aminopeptidase N
MAMLRDFAATYGGKPASTWDFQHLVENHANRKLEWFFDQWVFGMGVPTYKVDYKVEASGSAFIIEGTIKQTDVPDSFTMPVPLYADDEFLGRVTVSDAEGDFRFRVTKKPERVVIDPERTILTTIAQ